MGVPGLTTFIESVPNVYDVLEPAAGQQVPIIVDASSLKHYMHKRNSSSLLHSFLGGEPSAWIQTIKRGLKNLRELGLEPILVLDGTTPQTKGAILDERRKNRRSAHELYMEKTFDLEKSRSNKFSFTNPAGSALFMRACYDLGVKFVRADFEADTMIAHLASQIHAYILSSDDDFYIYSALPGVRGFVPLSKIKLFSPSESNTYVFDAHKFCDRFHVHPSHLPLLASYHSEETRDDRRKQNQAFFKTLDLLADMRDIPPLHGYVPGDISSNVIDMVVSKFRSFGMDVTQNDVLKALGEFSTQGAHEDARIYQKCITGIPSEIPKVISAGVTPGYIWTMNRISYVEVSPMPALCFQRTLFFRPALDDLDMVTGVPSITHFIGRSLVLRKIVVYGILFGFNCDMPLESSSTPVPQWDPVTRRGFPRFLSSSDEKAPFDNDQKWSSFGTVCIVTNAPDAVSVPTFINIDAESTVLEHFSTWKFLWKECLHYRLATLSLRTRFALLMSLFDRETTSRNIESPVLIKYMAIVNAIHHLRVMNRKYLSTLWTDELTRIVLVSSIWANHFYFSTDGTCTPIAPWHVKNGFQRPRHMCSKPECPWQSGLPFLEPADDPYTCSATEAVVISQLIFALQSHAHMSTLFLTSISPSVAALPDRPMTFFGPYIFRVLYNAGADALSRTVSHMARDVDVYQVLCAELKVPAV